MDSEYLKAYKSKLLETFEYTISFLNRHGINWWCCGGTAIGAIRHNGIIPWDDDIDIYVKRSDYQKLVIIREEFNNERFEVSHLSISSDACSRFMKIIDKSTTIQAKEFFPFVLGVFVDIFPLDYSNSDDDAIILNIKEMNKYYSKYFDCFKHYPVDIMLRSITSPKTLFQQMLTNYVTNRNKKEEYLKLAIMFDEKYKNNNCIGKCFCMHGGGGKKYKKNWIFQNPEWFEGYEEVSFDGLVARIPLRCNEYLEHRYGNFMQLPPEKDRIPTHDAYYVNLKERLTLEEIAQRVKHGETIVY